MLAYIITTTFLIVSWFISLFKKNQQKPYFATRAIYDDGENYSE